MHSFWCFAALSVELTLITRCFVLLIATGIGIAKQKSLFSTASSSMTSVVGSKSGSSAIVTSVGYAVALNSLTFESLLILLDGLARYVLLFNM